MIGILSSCTKIQYEATPAIKTLVDISDNRYLTQVIGSQTWMLSDLKTDKFNNGDWVQHAPGNYTFYDIEKGNLCPIGWHVPKSWEWSVLIDYFISNDMPIQIGNLGYWWSSSTLVEGVESPQAYSWYQNLEYQVPKEYVELKESFLSVRCIKDH
jgi:hypothetical protein